MFESENSLEYEKSPLTRKDLIRVQLYQSSTWIKNIFKEMIEYDLNNEDMIELIKNRFSEVLMTDINFDPNDTNEQKLQKLFDSSFYLRLFEDESRLLTKNNLVLKLNEILARKPVFEEIRKTNDVEEAKKQYTQQIVSLFSQGISLLKRNLVTQTIEVWKKYQSKSNANVKFSFQLNENLIKNFYSALRDDLFTIEQTDATVFNDDDIIDFQNTLSDIYESEFFTYKRMLLSLTLSIFKRQFILYETIKYSITIVSDVIRTDHLSTKFNTILNNSQERITLCSRVLGVFSKQNNDPNFFISLFVFMKQNTDHFRLYYSDNFDKSEIARTHLIGAQKDIFSSSFGLVSLTGIIDGMKLIFQSLNKADINDENIYELIQKIKLIKKFDPTVRVDKTKDVGQKLMIIDMILYLKSTEFTETMIKSIIDNFSALRTVPMQQRVQFSKTKLMFYDFTKPNRFLYDGDEQFYIDFYFMTLTFGEFVGESSFEEMPFIELFDLFLDDFYRTLKDPFINRHYLLFKFYNLFFLPENHSFVTHFPILKEDSEAVQTFVERINKQDDFGFAALSVFESLKDSAIDVITPQDITQLLKPEILADEFRVFSVTFHEKDPNINLEGNLQFKSLNASLKQESFAKGQSQNIPQLPSDSTKKIFQSTKYTGHDLSLHDLISTKKVPEISFLKNSLARTNSLKSMVSKGQNSFNNLQSLKNINNSDNDNIVVEMVNSLNENQFLGLKTSSVADFIGSHDVVITKDNVQTTYVFVVLTRASRLKYLKSESDSFIE